MPELMFCRDLEGYGWCVRKGEYLNVGIGRRGNQQFANHVKNFMTVLHTQYGVTAPANISWHGHAYLASGTGPRPLIASGMLVIGDAAGLAYPESGEGISPAIESAHLAAETLIAANGRFDAESLQPYATAIARLHPPAARSERLRGVVAAIGRLLLGSSTFTRHVLLDRWFLRTEC
jgi:flavin-dependent dehydrogenase